MSLRGHGAPGILSNLRDFAELVEESSAARRSLLELQPGFELTPGEWGRYDGNCYRQPLRLVVDGVLRDVVAVDTSAAPSALVRVETSAECVATPGTYFYDYDEAAGVLPDGYVPRFDDGDTFWDSPGFVWDYMPAALWVHLADGSDPALGTVVARFGFYYGTKAEVHPHLGPNKLTDGTLEEWTSPTNLTHWTENMDAGTSGNQDSTVVRRGTYSARLSMVEALDGATAALRQAKPTIVGKLYRLCGYYLTEKVALPITANIRVRDDAAAVDIAEDGLSTGAGAGGVDLEPTAGEWRSFCIDFVAFAASSRVVLRANNMSGHPASGHVWFDEVELRRVYGYWLYEPRLGSSSVPETESAKAAVFFGGKAVGLGQVSLLNGDRALYSAFGQLELLNSPAALYDGGAFADGEELLRQHYRAGFLGYTRDLDIDDQKATLALEDQWTFSQDPLPPRLYSRTEQPNLRGDADGKARPLLFGERTFYESEGDTYKMCGPIVPVRIDRDVETGYGVYEVCDPTNAPGPIEAFPTGS